MLRTDFVSKTILSLNSNSLILRSMRISGKTVFADWSCGIKSFRINEKYFIQNWNTRNDIWWLKRRLWLWDIKYKDQDDAMWFIFFKDTSPCYKEPVYTHTRYIYSLYIHTIYTLYIHTIFIHYIYIYNIYMTGIFMYQWVHKNIPNIFQNFWYKTCKWPLCT